tara:strand:+ start:1752 stop:2591 length:840 start_codon:yes stop_codon:yes gene_type:complete
MKSLNICGIFQNSEVYLREYLFPRLKLLEKKHPNIKFYYYFYENNSKDETGKLLKKFKPPSGQKVVWTEKTTDQDYNRADHRTMIERIQNITKCRNKLLSLRPFKGEWTMMIDADMIFLDSIIEHFVEQDLPSDLAGLTFNAIDRRTCDVHSSCTKPHYYDTLALKYNNGQSGYKTYLVTNEEGASCCPFVTKKDKDLWDSKNLMKVKSAFGGLSFYKTDFLNKEEISYIATEVYKGGEHYNEHVGMHKLLTQYGNIYLDPSMKIYNAETVFAPWKRWH